MRLMKILLPIACLLLLAGATAPTYGQAAGALGPAETLSGKIALVDTGQRVLVIEGARNVTYSFVVRPATRISADGRRLKLEELPEHKGKQATVKFIPTRRGNLAQTIEISG